MLRLLPLVLPPLPLVLPGLRPSRYLSTEGGAYAALRRIMTPL